MKFPAFVICIQALIAALVSSTCSADEVTKIDASQIRGGLCVIVGPLDWAMNLPVIDDPHFVVQVLSNNATRDQIKTARETLYQRRHAGRVTVERQDQSRLPYVENLVSLLLVNDQPQPDAVPELLRVLRPDGEMLVRDRDRWQRTVKPRPTEMDEWSQWRHGPDRNAVSKDRIVDVPQRVQWLFSSSIVQEAADMVTARGRVFIQDRDTLLARDAFNGLPLWHANLYPHKKLGIEKPPALIVARDDCVFALMHDGKFKSLDAATGAPLQEFAGAGLPNAVLLLDDQTLVLATEDGLRAFESRTAKLLWEHSANEPHTVTAGGGSVFYLEGNDKKGAGSGDVLSRDLKTGELQWKRSYEWARRSDLASYGMGKIVFEVRRPAQWRDLWTDKDREKADKFQLAVIDAKTGQEDQKLFGVASSARHGEFCTAFWHQGQLLTEARTSKGLGIARYSPSDFSKPTEIFQANFAGDRGWGHCYPPVLTERFYINGQMHFTDLTAKQQTSNAITRGACHVLRAGYIPANGMIYTFPKHCVCFPMLNGTTCLAPEAKLTASTPQRDEHPLEKGPAFKVATRAPADTSQTTTSSSDWPMFRHDEFRSGGTDAAAPSSLDIVWSANVGTVTAPKSAATPKKADKNNADHSLTAEWSDNPWTAGSLSAPVIAGGLVYVSQCDAQRLWAFDAATGRVRWHANFSGRLDGPPTIEQGLALIGCRDGWVTALRASDGVLAWRRRIAPFESRISSYGQLESAWPCAASVLVSRGLAYVSAGFHPNADGGIRVACLRPLDGELLWINKFDDLGFDSAWPDEHDPRTKDKPGIVSDPWRTIRPQEYRHFDMPVRDGNSIAVSRCAFDALTGRVELRKASGYYEVSPSGAKMPRTSWRYTDVQARSPLAVNRGPTVVSTSPRKAVLFRADFAKGAIDKFNTDWVNVPHEQFKAGVSHASSKIYESGFRWSQPLSGETDSYPRAMLIVGDSLLYAAPTGDLSLRDLKDGRELQRKKLPKLAWDSLAAVPSRIYATTSDGQLLCLGSKPR